MPKYDKACKALMRGIDYALLEMDRMNYGMVKHYLQQAQRDAEKALDEADSLLILTEDRFEYIID